MKVSKILFSNWTLVLLLTILFGVWMLVFDRNSFFDIKDLDNRIKELENERDFYIQKIAEDSAVIVGLKDSAYLEKYAREHYYMKREGETMYITK